MDRVIFKKGFQNKLLTDVKLISGLSDEKIGKICGVHGRTIGDWKREKTSMPFNVIETLSKKYSLILPPHQIKPIYWHLSKAGKIGGVARFKKYGLLGDINSRRKGGIKSQMVNKSLGTNFKQRKKINNPVKSCELAEFIGIMLGDGGIGNYQITISLNSFTDLEYSVFVIKLSEKLFGLKSRKFFRENTCLQVCISGIELVGYLLNEGLSCNKVAAQVGIPAWIIDSTDYSKSCLRGLIDTDGCVYIDRHKFGKNNYSSICLDFSNHSQPLLNFVFDFLEFLDLHPKKYKFSIKLRRKLDIAKYFELIGSSNPKHLRKFYNFEAKRDIFKERSHSG